MARTDEAALEAAGRALAAAGRLTGLHHPALLLSVRAIFIAEVGAGTAWMCVSEPSPEAALVVMLVAALVAGLLRDTVPVWRDARGEWTARKWTKYAGSARAKRENLFPVRMLLWFYAVLVTSMAASFLAALPPGDPSGLRELGPWGAAFSLTVLAQAYAECADPVPPGQGGRKARASFGRERAA